MRLRIKILEAFDGDSFLISFPDGENVRNILIDGGTRRTYPRALSSIVKSIVDNGQNIDLLIVTHIHDDHIDGILGLYEDTSIDKSVISNVWFNSKVTFSKYLPSLIESTINLAISDRHLSFKQGNCLENELKKTGCWNEDLIMWSEKYKDYNFYNANLTVLTPRLEGLIKLDKEWNIKREQREIAALEEDYKYSIEQLIARPFIEDESIENKSSISFLFEYYGIKILMLGDAHPSDIIISLKELGYSKDNKLQVDFVKLSHHGSKANTCDRLISIIKCKNYIVSTNGSSNAFPHKECLAKVICGYKDGVNLYFNYDCFDKIFSKEEQKKYNISCIKKSEIEV